MGRGRAKAKQTKVARELKYHSPDTDFASLQRELGRAPTSSLDSDQYDEYDGDDSEDEDAVDADAESDDGADDDDGNWAARRR